MASRAHVGDLIQFILSKGIDASEAAPCGYRHMGATLCDSVLQAGLNYNTVVKPRVSRLLRTFPSATTTSKLLDLIDEFGAEHLLNWKHPEKPMRLIAVANFLYVRSIETENCLREWLQAPANASRLGCIRGIGPKTIDYLKILIGIPAVAVDRHIRTFVEQAGFTSNNYLEIRRIVEEAADQLQVHRTSLDYAIWVYVSQSKSRARVSAPNEVAVARVKP